MMIIISDDSCREHGWNKRSAAVDQNIHPEKRLRFGGTVVDSGVSWSRLEIHITSVNMASEIF
jgi:starvation-inducible outer membrane lipoprotein